MLLILDHLMTTVHTAFIAANLFLWIPRSTRRWHLGVVFATAFSWLALGPLLGRGAGYCLLTDWHWDIKHALGQRGLPSSFITYLFGLLGIDAASWANSVTATTFTFVTLLSVGLNTRDWVRR